MAVSRHPGINGVTPSTAGDIDMNPLAAKYAQVTHRLAGRVARDIHSSLDAEVVRQLGESFSRDAAVSGEARNLSSYLARWRHRASVTSAGLVLAGFVCLGLTANTRNPINRLITANGAIACWFGAKTQRRIVEESQPILGTLARIQAAQSAIALSQLWERPNLSQLSEPVAVESPLRKEPGLRLFDLNRLRDCDTYPHFLVCGGTGSGKTYTTERLVKFIGGDISVITTKAKSDQWQGLKVVGKGRDFPAIEKALISLLGEMNRRMQDLDANHQPKIVVLDEFPSITANIEAATDIVTTLIREAREAKIRLFILSQGRQVKTLKLEGQSDLRENLTDILLGQFA